MAGICYNDNGDKMKNIYLFLGLEEVIIKNKIDTLLKKFSCDEYNTKTYDLEVSNVYDAVQDAITMPFISEKKVVIIKNPTFLSSVKIDIPHNVAAFLQYIVEPLETTVLIIDATHIKLDERKEVVKRLLTVAEVSDTKKLSPDEEEGWLVRQFELAGIQIRQDAIKAFFGRVGRNLTNAKNEIDKLISYVNGRKIITVKDVVEVVSKELEQETYALTGAIIEKNKEKIITIFQELTKSGKDSVQLLSIIARSMSENLIVSQMIEAGFSQADIASFLEVSMGRAYYMMKNAKTFQVNIIQERISQLADLDFKIKTGQIDSLAGLEMFLFSL